MGARYAKSKHGKRQLSWCPRLFLHASRLTFLDDGEAVDVQADLPQDLTAVLASMKEVASPGV